MNCQGPVSKPAMHRHVGCGCPDSRAADTGSVTADGKSPRASASTSVSLAVRFVNALPRSWSAFLGVALLASSPVCAHCVPVNGSVPFTRCKDTSMNFTFVGFPHSFLFHFFQFIIVHLIGLTLIFGISDYICSQTWSKRLCYTYFYIFSSFATY